MKTYLHNLKIENLQKSNLAEMYLTFHYINWRSRAPTALTNEDWVLYLCWLVHSLSQARLLIQSEKRPISGPETKLNPEQANLTVHWGRLEKKGVSKPGWLGNVTLDTEEVKDIKQLRLWKEFVTCSVGNQKLHVITLWPK